jgi:hypothetical protein
VNEQEQIAQLIERLAEAEKALEFYADEINWDVGHHHSTFDCVDVDDHGRDEDGMHWGGKRARDYFEKWRTGEKGE